MTKFQNIIGFFLIAVLSISCGKESEANFTLKGSIKGLKKGVVYLQKEGDSTIINVDSLVINGQPEFSLKTNIEEPTLLYLKLDKKDGQDYFIPFFADKGVTEIKTSLKQFNFDASIKGSKQQELLDEYLKLMKGFNDRNLDLLKANFLASKGSSKDKSDSLTRLSNRLVKLKYASTINFALNNNDSEIAPYLALYEIPNTSIKFLDTIYNTLTDNVKQSQYGKTLGEAIEKYRTSLDSIITQ